jgi:hypothetical protein
LGRWLTRDPIEESGGVGLYTFVSNTPTTLLDALGQAPPANPPPVWSGTWRDLYDPPPPPPPGSIFLASGAQQFFQSRWSTPGSLFYDPSVFYNASTNVTEAVVPRGTLKAPITKDQAKQRWGQLEPNGTWPAGFSDGWLQTFNVPAELRNAEGYRWIDQNNAEVTHFDNVNVDFIPLLETALLRVVDRELVCELRNTAGVYRSFLQGSGVFHNYGSAIDINTDQGQQHVVPTLHPHLVRAFISSGLYWGGWWSDTRIDGMHFSFGF